MAATYPGGVYSPRVIQNKSGVIYDENKKTVMFAEDLNKSNDEIVAIETELGTAVKGTFGSLKLRIEDLEQRVTALEGP